jgi:hypothetical protein
MTDTAKLSLPLLAPSQAQKHVTVNEALGRLDAIVQLSALSRTITTPPVAAPEGETYLVPPGAVNAWSGKSGQVASWQNGGWLFLMPRAGWRAFVSSDAKTFLYDGTDWSESAVAVTPGGAAMSFSIREFDHVVAAGASSTTAAELPANTVVFGITARVLSDVTGTQTSWRLGVAGSDDRYGTGIGNAEASWVRGLTGSPLTYYAQTALLLTAEGGSFGGAGTVRFAVHYAALGLPRPA